MRSLLLTTCAVLLVASGCYRSIELPRDAAVDAPIDAGCGPTTLRCVARGDDACARPEWVDPICDPASAAWTCPPGARAHARAVASSSSCLPYHDEASGLRSVSGAEARIPTDDGRCLVVFEDVVTRDGRALRNVAIEEDLDAPFGTCPTHARFLGGGPTESVRVEGDDDEAVLVQLTGAFRAFGRTRVIYRLFRIDASSGFGVTDVGTGLGHFDGATNRIVVGDVASLPFPPSIDLGDGVIVDRGSPYVFGCPSAPTALLEDCFLARFDASDVPSYWGGHETFVASPGDAVRVFRAGPWISSLVRTPGGTFLHVYVAGFGDRIEYDRATSVVGPYASSISLAACDLPAGDREAFCAGPVVHEELEDPALAEIVVGHSIGTLAPNGATRRGEDPDAYWTRWLRVPSPP